MAERWITRFFDADRVPVHEVLAGAFALGVILGIFLGGIVLPAVGFWYK